MREVYQAGSTGELRDPNVSAVNTNDSFNSVP